MTGRSVSVYLSKNNEELLKGIGPQFEDGGHIGIKVGWAIPTLDLILRSHAKRWRVDLDKPCWDAVIKSSWSTAFAMDSGESAELDIGAVAANIHDAPLEEIGITEEQREEIIRVLDAASAADQLALVWLIIRERRRRGKG